MPSFDWDGVFQEEFTKAVNKDAARSGFEPDTWFVPGRGKTQREPWWRENGPQYAASFGEWFESTPDAKVWVAPDGRPAIELELRVSFGGIPVVMYVDLILMLGSALVVTDFKSSAKEPADLKQQGFYACGVELFYGKPYRPKYGTHFMCRGQDMGDGEPRRYFMPPQPLDAYRYSVPYFTRQLEMLNRGVDAGVFPANPGDFCRICGVNYACDAVGGADAPNFRAKG